MARDYKNAGRGDKKKGAGKLPGPIWLLMGLVLGVTAGLLIGLGVFTVRVVQELRTEIKATMAQHPDLDADKLRKAIAIVEAQRKQEQGPDGRPRFEFYDMLPQMEVQIPKDDGKPGAVKKPAAEQPPAVAGKERYLLQVASFQKHADADRMKAQLALLGVQANIQTVEIKPGDTVHRVRVGPFSDRNELSDVRKRLQANGIEAVVVKLSG